MATPAHHHQFFSPEHITSYTCGHKYEHTLAPLQCRYRPQMLICCTALRTLSMQSLSEGQSQENIFCSSSTSLVCRTQRQVQEMWRPSTTRRAIHCWPWAQRPTIFQRHVLTACNFYRCIPKLISEHDIQETSSLDFLWRIKECNSLHNDTCSLSWQIEELPVSKCVRWRRFTLHYNVM